MSEPSNQKWMSVRHAGLEDAEPFTEVKFAIPFGIMAVLFALASMAMCTGPAVAEFLFDLQENSLDPNPHVQALLMSIFGLISVLAMWRDSRIHGRWFPYVLGAVGVSSMIATLYIRYHAEIEALSYALLVVAALLNLNSFAGLFSRMAQQQARKIELLNQVIREKLNTTTAEINRLSFLKQLVPAPVADLVVNTKPEETLRTHRRYVACLFCDLRGFTAFSEEAEPEEVVAVLNDYHGDIDRLAGGYNGTIGFRAGDGIMVFFNDPLPCDEPVFNAVRLALAARARFDGQKHTLEERGFRIGIGMGIASGYATIGLVGTHGRRDYTAVGNCVNVAARLCDSAKDGQILISQRAHADVVKQIDAEILPPLIIKGIAQPVTVFSVLTASGLDENATHPAM